MNPAERYQTMEELEAALNQTEAPVSRQKGKKKKPALLLAGVLICAVIGVFAWMPQLSDAADSAGPADAEPAMVEGTEYYQLYKSGGNMEYINFRFGGQSAPLFTQDDERVDESWTVYADPEIGFIEDWNPKYEGWTLNSEGCTMGETGYIHAEKNGRHYAIQVLVQGEPMSAYSVIPSEEKLTEGYLQPVEAEGYPYPGVINLTYKPGEDITLYLAAMEGFSELQPVCDSSLVTIKPFEEAEDWELPVYTMTFRNPAGGTVQLEVESNCSPLQFIFEEQ